MVFTGPFILSDENTTTRKNLHRTLFFPADNHTDMKGTPVNPPAPSSWAFFPVSISTYQKSLP